MLRLLLALALACAALRAVPAAPVDTRRPAAACAFFAARAHARGLPPPPGCQGNPAFMYGSSPPRAGFLPAASAQPNPGDGSASAAAAPVPPLNALASWLDDSLAALSNWQQQRKRASFTRNAEKKSSNTKGKGKDSTKKELPGQPGNPFRDDFFGIPAAAAEEGKEGVGKTPTKGGDVAGPVFGKMQRVDGRRGHARLFPEKPAGVLERGQLDEWLALAEEGGE